MIIYQKGLFGLQLLLRCHGSGLYRAMIPGLFSVLIYFLIYGAKENESEREGNDLNHPYAIGVLVGSVSFLIVFRANYGYQRYWEACGATFHMMSKWLDATSHTACYHMQCDHYENIKPPSYYDYPDLNGMYLTRDRERGLTAVESSVHDLPLSRGRKSIEYIKDKRKRHATRGTGSDLYSFDDADDGPRPLMGVSRLDGGWEGLFPDHTATYYHKSKDHLDKNHSFADTSGGRTPSLFLQELAHLSSLLCAVALSTLRNDVEGAESPLDIYKVGEPWPDVDPDSKLKRERSWGRLFLNLVHYSVSTDRRPEARTAYNKSRPLPVLGGVSDAEIKFLQMARGPSAKTQLAWQWLSEFITREHLAGSTGKVGPPIISRIIQFLGDGMIFYNHARKIMYIPFPFPHAQLSVFYVLVVVPTVPFMMEQYTNEAWLGALLSFLTVTCLAGLHEVARELENPFRNVPNEIPLVTLQAMFNEALITMYAGYHPDAYWDPEKYRKHREIPEEEPLNKAPTSKNEEQEVVTEKQEQTTIEQLQSLVEKQSKEIERLRNMVEGQTKKDN